MKKFLVSLFFTMFAFQVNAATYSWTDLTGSVGTVLSSTGPSSTEINVTNFAASAASADTYDYDFNIAGGPVRSSSLATEFVATDFDVTSVRLIGIGIDQLFVDLGVGLDGLNSWVLNPSLLLETGDYTVRIAMEVLSEGIVNVQVSAVPVPAAVWLFGSALMGLVGASRRKSSVMAA